MPISLSLITGLTRMAFNYNYSSKLSSRLSFTRTQNMSECFFYYLLGVADICTTNAWRMPT